MLQAVMSSTALTHKRTGDAILPADITKAIAEIRIKTENEAKRE
jgi:hypothetical protein